MSEKDNGLSQEKEIQEAIDRTSEEVSEKID